jgi:hypothetical protein
MAPAAFLLWGDGLLVGVKLARLPLARSPNSFRRVLTHVIPCLKWVNLRRVHFGPTRDWRWTHPASAWANAKSSKTTFRLNAMTLKGN